ncbi:MAG: helix-turn-helix domain-containing protein [Pseudomonadota bacterium]|nr:helix-turn-helix domain-containing protein [Pseudomonadota bacterium]
MRLDQRRAITVIEALGQGLRLDIWRLLAAAGPEGVTAGRLAERLEIPPSSLSFPLQTLRHAGLVTGRRSSRSIIYAAAYAPLEALVCFLASYGSPGDATRT